MSNVHDDYLSLDVNPSDVTRCVSLSGISICYCQVQKMEEAFRASPERTFSLGGWPW